MRRTSSATPTSSTSAQLSSRPKKRKGRTVIITTMSVVAVLLVSILAMAHYSFHTSVAAVSGVKPRTDLEKQSRESPSSAQVMVQRQSKPTTTSPHTIVTAYFQIRSKYQKETYMEWMSTMLSLQDPMVIFTTPDWVDAISSLRPAGALTTIIPMQLTDVPLATDYDADYWQHQLDIDPEKKRHAGYQVFWIWLSKTHFVMEAIRKNPFESDLFVWSDIGCFRGGAAGRYKNKLLMQHPDVLPRDRILFLSHKDEPDPPASVWWNNKLREKQHFYHSGSQMMGYKDAFTQYHAAFLKTFAGFNERKLFVGDDQPVFQCTCLQNPNLCAYVKRTEVKDNHYFGLRYVVFHGGKFHFWYPPALKEDVDSK